MLRLRHFLQFGVLLLVTTWLLSSSLVTAVDVTVSATVDSPTPDAPDTTAEFTGLVYPNAQVVLQQDGANLTTVQADPSAVFAFSEIVTPGSHTYTLIPTDIDGRTGKSSSFSLSLSEGATVTVSNIFLSPTLVTTFSDIKEDESLLAQGITAPNSSITIFLTSDLVESSGGIAVASAAEVETAAVSRQFVIVADVTGYWSRVFTGSELGVGSHIAQAQATAPSTAVSELSSAVGFSVGASSPCSGSTPGDINCDGSVDIVDFSILLFYWNVTNPANARADINGDTTVNVTDFSIMLFYWTG